MEQEAQKLQGELFSKTFSTDLAAEFILPDYQPEIKRLLRVRAIPLPVDQYLGASAAEFSGTVEFQALYAAEDHSLWCVTKREDYQLSCPFDGTGDLDDVPVCDVRTETEGVSGRVTAPRKLTARCRVRTQVRTLADRSASDLSPAEEPGEIERLTGTMETSRTLLGRSAPVTLTEEILLDTSQPPMRVISASAQVFPTEVQAGENLVACRGEVWLSLLCAAEEAPAPTTDGDCLPAAATPTELLRKLPFAVEVPVDGATPQCACNARGTCSEIAVTVEDQRILCDVTFVLDARAVCREEVSYTEDAFSLTHRSEPVFCTLPAEEILCCRNGNCSVSATKSLSELGVRSGAQVLEAFALPVLQPAETVAGKWTLPGSLHFQILLQQPDRENVLSEFDVPFRFESPVTAADAETPPDAGFSTVTPMPVKASADDDRLLVETELSVALTLSAPRSLTCVKSLKCGDPLPQNSGAAILLCFPESEDSLWSVAKKYHTPVQSLQQKNNLSDSIQGVRYLVI